jgi:hypothetical protein
MLLMKIERSGNAAVTDKGKTGALRQILPICLRCINHKSAKLPP